jgi:two-component sensor histidine kinase
MSAPTLFEPGVADVFITDELALRAPKKVDYLQEKRALQELAERMADAPENMLPRFVDLAMEMTGGVSAGLSLYEENPSPGVFRWRYLRGVLAPFNGATTPRDFSPCGITLDRNAPVLSSHPERVYDWIAEANIVVPEVLLVPLYLGGTEPLGTLWIVSDEEGHFDSGHARAMTELASFVGTALRMLKTEQSLQRALQEQETLAREMSHRVKNLFSMIDALIRISGKSVATAEEMTKLLSGRLQALASAHALVRRSFSPSGQLPQSSNLKALIKAIVVPHERPAADAVSRFLIEGPPVACGEHATNGIALVFHELTTNAAKYGALRCDKGTIDVTWQQDGDSLVLQWLERDGPTIEAPPATSGFGSALAQATIVRQFGGTLDCDWRRSGLVVTITLPISRLAV